MQSDQCVKCMNYLGMFKCEAYPNGIPREIYEGTHDHKESFKGDNGIRFEEFRENP